jgi:hypothetical protein
MPVTMTYDLDKKTADDFFAQVDRAMKTLGKSQFQALQWAARLLCQSLGAQTKIASKRPRKIVHNPNDAWKTDKRRAPFGVMGYKKGEEVFKPIYRAGEYGKIRFYAPHVSMWFDRRGGSGKWKKISDTPDIANPEIVFPSLANSPKRLIPRRGLAKKAWQAANTLIGRGGIGNGMGVSRIASVQLNQSETDPTVTLNNMLRYAGDAFKNGEASIGQAMAAATSKLMYRIQQERDKQLGLNLK